MRTGMAPPPPRGKYAVGGDLFYLPKLPHVREGNIGIRGRSPRPPPRPRGCDRPSLRDPFREEPPPAPARARPTVVPCLKASPAPEEARSRKCRGGRAHRACPAPDGPCHRGDRRRNRQRPPALAAPRIWRMVRMLQRAVRARATRRILLPPAVGQTTGRPRAGDAPAVTPSDSRCCVRRRLQRAVG